MLNVAHFVSWWWTTMAHVANLANRWDLGDVRSTLVVASKEGIGAIEKAKKLGIPYVVVNPKDEAQILWALTRHKSDVIIGNGYIPPISKVITDAYQMPWKFGYNQHPGNLRADHQDFWWNVKDKGMWGSRVVAANTFYLLSGREIWEPAYTECSVHRLTEKIDDGGLVGMNSLNITPDLDEYQLRNWLLVAWKDIELTPELDSLIRWKSDERWVKIEPWIQGRLLPLEHFTVAQVMQILWEWKTPEILPIYRQPLNLDPARLDWAKRQAARLYPKG